MAQRSLRNARGILTGASSGIGHALALKLAGRGARLVLVARREEKLRELAAEITARGGTVEIVAGDVTDSGVRRAAVERAVACWGGLDLLVNNAGVGAIGRFESADPDRLRKIMEVNFFAAAELIRQALPVLRQGERPIVVNVASILGQRGIPWHSEYCASKFALRGFSEALRPELARLQIDLLVVSPGTTETEFFDHLIEQEAKPPWPKQRGVPASEVARATARAIEHGKHEIVPNPRGRILCWINRLLPRLVDRIVGRYG